MNALTRHLACLLIWCTAATVRAAEPAQPFIGFAFPAGGQRGMTVQVTVGGQNLLGGTQVRVTGAGVAARVENVKDAGTGMLSVTIAPDAMLGEREIRLVTPGGASNRFRFIVGQLPELNEKEPNSRIGEAQRLDSLPVVINGQLMQADDDCFRFAAKAGQTIVCRVEARSLVPYIADAVPGWNDTCLTLCDSAGREITSVDDFRFHPDPVLIYEVPRDGEYVVKLKDVLYRGRADFAYRLSIGQLPHITHAYPLGGTRDTTLPLSLLGVNLPIQRLDLRLPPHVSPSLHEISLDGSNVLPLSVDDLTETVEDEPNDISTAANEVVAPRIINGRIDRPGDADWFSFHAEKSQVLVMEVQARRLDSPVDGVLTLFNAQGRKIAKNDDTVDAGRPLLTHHADPRLLFTIPAKGTYTLQLCDVQGKGGEAYAYRLLVAPPRPDFALRVSPDNPRLADGDSAHLTVTAIRKDGFAGPIDLSVAGLPAGFLASAATISAGQTQTSLTVTAPSDAPDAVLTPAVVGRATIGEQDVMRQATPAEQVMQAFSYTHAIPTSELVLSVIESQSFAVSSDRAPTQVIDVQQGGDVPVTLAVSRKPGERGGIALKGVGLPKGVSIKPMFIPADQDETTISIGVSKQVPVGRHNIILTATLKSGKDAATRTVPAIPLRVVGASK